MVFGDKFGYHEGSHIKLCNSDSQQDGETCLSKNVKLNFELF